jgi:hypothetical protein
MNTIYNTDSDRYFVLKMYTRTHMFTLLCTGQNGIASEWLRTSETKLLLVVLAASYASFILILVVHSSSVQTV